MEKSKRLGVAILGSTGIVGQRFIELLEKHPWFEVREIIASEKSAGRRYKEVSNWLLESKMPEEIGEMTVKKLDPDKIESDLVFSALPVEVARDVEKKFAKSGKVVVSKANAFRMEEDIPLMIPEVNPGHLSLIEIQKKKRGWKGFIVTDPNCTTIGLTLVLKPILDKFGINEIIVTTMQALSGAGIIPGVPSLLIHGNIIPFISGEEEKLESEPLKILGEFNEVKKIKKRKFRINATCTRVPVIDGHMISLHVKTKKEVSLDEVKKVLKSFRGVPQELSLPSAPIRPIIVKEKENRPQPILDKNEGSGMSSVVGRIKVNKKEINLVILSHNTIRGAAGAGILNAELLFKKGFIKVK